MNREHDHELLLAHADLALYQAKGEGKNRARLFVPEQHPRAVQRVDVVHRVRQALDTGQLQLDAQPIVDLADGRVCGYELLVRVDDGREPRIMPGDFLPALERGDMVCELDRWVIRTAVGALAVPPTRLGLEITEAAAIANPVAARRLAATLTAAGCGFGLDDFGAGYGSFVYLKHLPFTTVKIAGEFVRHADHGGSDPILIDAVVRAAHGLGMQTVAEHVDRPELVPVLRQLGVDRGQGFHLGQPERLDELMRRTITRRPSDDLVKDEIQIGAPATGKVKDL
jgi:EAL domain-containing protein (putative c-di-GMP-specific phosphodiesterase class I)